MGNILITGAGGFIGSNLIQALQHYPDIFSSIYALTRNNLNIHGIICVNADILDAEYLDRLFKSIQFDMVVHLAAITAHNEIVAHRQETFQINLYGTINLLNCFNKYCKNALFVFASTGKVYGKTNEMPITENAHINPQNILGKSKRVVEEIIEYCAEVYNQYLICRIFNIYGPFQRRSFLVPTIIDQLGQNEIHLGNLKDLRDYLYIDDLISAIIGCLRCKKEFETVEYVNIGSGEAASVTDILREFEKVLSRKLNVHVDSARMRKDETAVEFCDYSKIASITKWKPKYSLHDGIEKTLRKENVI